MEAEWAEKLEGNVNGFFGNCDRGCGWCEDLVEEMVYCSVDDVTGISILLEIFHQVFDFFIYVCP